MIKKIKRFLQLVNILSLDIVVNALVLSVMIGLVTHLNPNPVALVLLAMAVWGVYTFDHILDALKSKGNYLSIRHTFHKRNKKSLFVILVLLIAIGIYVAIQFLPIEILLVGLAFTGFCSVYLVYCYVFQKYLLPKEIIISIIYTAGLWVPYATNFQEIIHLNNILLFFLMYFTVLNNLILFSAIEINEDLKSNFDSIFIRNGFLNPKYINFSIILVVIAIFFVNILELHTHITIHNSVSNYLEQDQPYILASILFLIINLMYILILIYKHTLFLKHNYRLISDNLFLLFLILYII